VRRSGNSREQRILALTPNFLNVASNVRVRLRSDCIIRRTSFFNKVFNTGNPLIVLQIFLMGGRSERDLDAGQLPTVKQLTHHREGLFGVQCAKKMEPLRRGLA
jgi:hypothetical protein